MKKLICIVIILSATLHVQAQYWESQNMLDQLVWDDEKLNIYIDTRIDFQNLIEQGKLDNMSFVGQTVRIWLFGEVVPGIRYRIRHRINKLSETSLRDNYSGATDHAFLAFDIGSNWTITAGKQPVQIGTFENDYNGADVYLGTMVFNDFAGSATGVNVAYKFARQIMDVQVVNSDNSQFANTDYQNKALAINVLWIGDLFNKVIRTRWGYGTFQHTRTKFYNWGTLGTQFNTGKITTEFDYYTGIRNMDYGYMVNDDELGVRYVQDQSISLNVEYNGGKWRPFIKGIWDKRYDKNMHSTAYRSLGIQAVVEYYPFTNPRTKDLRFHLAYAYKNTDFRGHFEELTNTDTHYIIAGTRWFFKAK